MGAGWRTGRLGSCWLLHGATGSERGHAVQARGRTQLGELGSQKMGWVGRLAAMEAREVWRWGTATQVIRT